MRSIFFLLSTLITSYFISCSTVAVVSMPSSTSRCGTSLRKSKQFQQHYHHRHPRSISMEYDFKDDGAIYFDDEAYIQFPLSIYKLAKGFTIQFWIKPEGGQKNPTTIVGLYDRCFLRYQGLMIGLKEKNPGKQSTIFFSLQTDSSNKISNIKASKVYRANKWINIAATYNQKIMKLYMDGAQVGINYNQQGELFTNHSAICRIVQVGGDEDRKSNYRGSMDEIRIYKYARSQHDIRAAMSQSLKFHIQERDDNNGLILYENFNGIVSWIIPGRKKPRRVNGDIRDHLQQIEIPTPTCGLTVCDNKEIISNYVKFSQLRAPKVVKYRVINVYLNDGKDPLVSHDQLIQQDAYLNKAFAPYGIQWQLHEYKIFNTSIRQRYVIYGCSPEMVGDGACQAQCNISVTGYDGGDCINMQSYNQVGLCQRETQVDNGLCNAECNNRQYNWDGGDCCDPNNSITGTNNCLDPSSEHRIYLSIDEYKRLINLTSQSFLNVYFAHWPFADLVGVATFPWEKEVQSVLGGTIVKPEYYGKDGYKEILVHEFGHNLGLWHVHHGISELTCSDKCYEHQASMELGDLCSDTSPTPVNNQCSNPSNHFQDNCYDHLKFNNTPFRNYMSYVNESCANSFTPQQSARMHCYLDLKYSQWLVNATAPAAVPLAPKIVQIENNTIQLSWIPPLRYNTSNDDSTICDLCHEDGVLIQYASKGYSPYSYRPFPIKSWSPEYAITGPPDADTCQFSSRAWIANEYCNASCYVDVSFAVSVIPRQLSIWVSQHSNNINEDILPKVILLFNDGSHEVYSNVIVQCDVPVTISVWTNRVLRTLRIFTQHPSMAIDAVQLLSASQYSSCKSCKKLTYKISRKPPFDNDKVFTTTSTVFSDTVDKSVTKYLYQIQAINHDEVGPLSPPLQYISRTGFCGDGAVDTGEQCDDGNTRDGDGCNVQCQVEEFYNCKNEPSVCYMYIGDGVCEAFEERTNVKDCGFYTPKGFRDQWASSALANPSYQADKCDDFEKLILGPPSVDHKCVSNLDMDSLQTNKLAWYPCDHWYEDADYWIEVHFTRPSIASALIIYLATDGDIILLSKRTRLYIKLIDTDGIPHDISPNGVLASCQSDPLLVPVLHDMTKPFYYVSRAKISFSSYEIAISAVALRSLITTDALSVYNCASNELYNPRTSSCYPYTCQQPTCSPYLVKAGTVNCSTAREGETCQVLCRDGYTTSQENSYSIRCKNGQWDDSGNICKPVTCGEPPKIDSALVACLNGRHFGDMCTFKCISPAKLIGKNNTITCTADGYWSLPQAYCYLTCKSPTQPINSIEFNCNNVNFRQNNLLKIGHYGVGSYCKFQCAEGYRSSNRPSHSSALPRITCSRNGQWQGAKCLPISCSPPPALRNGLYNCTGTTFASVCTRFCFDENHKTTHGNIIRCDSDGKWHGRVKHCPKPRKQCPKPTSSQDVTFTCSNGNSIGQSCSVTCNINQKIPNYERITCLSNQTWQPPLAQLKCSARCLPEYNSDGWCDMENNRPECEYDGGDCCQSTSIEGMVIHMFEEMCSGPNIPKECNCLDPNAVENKT